MTSTGRAQSWLVGAILLLAFAAKGLLLVPPTPSPQADFDTGRAIQRLARILGDQQPHPADSDANDAVRDRLIAELTVMGLKPAVRVREDCSGLPGFREVSCSLTHNVVAVIGAERPGKALLLNAHYDSTPTGPGASDDGVGVATLLEVGANLVAKPIAHPVILLFNEGEEFGLNGASAFAEGDPLAQHVGALINIDTRGVTGPAFMFETSEPNGAALTDYAAATRRPVASSLSADFAKLIPNYTDVVIFKQHARWRTLSYGIIGNETRYHSPGDTIQALDRASLGHVGSEVLAAARTLDPAPSMQAQWAYADIASRFLFRLPLLAGVIAMMLLLAAGLWLAWRRKALGRPLIAVTASLAAGVGAAAIASFFAGLFRDGDYWRAFPLVPYLAIYAIILAAQLSVLRLIGGKTGTDNLSLASWLLTLVLGGLLCLIVPGAVIYFLLAPALATAAAFLPRFRTPLYWSAALVQLVMVGELLASVEMLLIDGPLYAVAPLAALAALPFLAMIVDRPVRAVALMFAVIGAALWAVSLLMPRSSAERPAAFTLDYVRDDGAEKGWWAVASKQAPLPKSWNAFGPWDRGVLPYSGRTRWLAAAPLLDVPKAGATVLGSSKVNGGRLVTLRFDRGGANAMMIRVGDDVRVSAMGLPGQLRPIAADTKPQPSILRCTGRACDGLVVALVIDSRTPVEAKLIATRFSLPPEGRRLEALRPRNAIPQYGPDSSIRISDIAI